MNGLPDAKKGGSDTDGRERDGRDTDGRLPLNLLKEKTDVCPFVISDSGAAPCDSRQTRVCSSHLGGEGWRRMRMRFGVQGSNWRRV